MTAVEIGGLSLGTVLLGVIAYFLRTRDARLTSVEKQAENSCKDVAVINGWVDTISKRLSAGAESFKDITNTQKQIQENLTYIVTHYVQAKTFEKEQDKTAAKFDKVDGAIDNLREVVTEIKLSMQGIEKTMQGGIGTMKDLLAKVVKIPTDPKDAL